MLSGLRLLSDGMEQLEWAGGWHVTRFLYSRDTNLHLPVVLAMLVSAGELKAAREVIEKEGFGK